VLDEALGAASPGPRRCKTLARWLEKRLQHGKRLDLPVNRLATGMWHDALVRKGSRLGVLAEGGGYENYLVGVIVVISGNSRLMDELFIRLPGQREGEC
jgi:hypothetical protein